MQAIATVTTDRGIGIGKVGELFKMISDQGNVVLSKFITYFGVSVGLGGGTMQAVTNASTNPTIQEFATTCAEVAPAWLSYAPFIAAVSLALKHTVDIVLNTMEHRRTRKESE